MSGERLSQLSGVAAILRFPLPDDMLGDIEESSSDSDSDADGTSKAKKLFSTQKMAAALVRAIVSVLAPAQLDTSVVADSTAGSHAVPFVYLIGSGFARVIVWAIDHCSERRGWGGVRQLTVPLHFVSRWRRAPVCPVRCMTGGDN